MPISSIEHLQLAIIFISQVDTKRAETPLPRAAAGPLPRRRTLIAINYNIASQ
jgi:hypothetical protein